MAIAAEVPAGLLNLGEEPYECLNGQLVRKESVGRLQHSHLGKVIERLLKPIATAQHSHVAAEWTVYHGALWATPDVTLAYPDAVIRHGYVQAPVPLVVESVSTGQRHNALFRKCFETYHSWQILYCWVIDTDERAAFEVHREWSGLVRPATTLTAGSEIRLELSTILEELDRELHPF